FHSLLPKRLRKLIWASTHSGIAAVSRWRPSAVTCTVLLLLQPSAPQRIHRARSSGLRLRLRGGRSISRRLHHAAVEGASSPSPAARIASCEALIPAALRVSS